MINRYYIPVNMQVFLHHYSIHERAHATILHNNTDVKSSFFKKMHHCIQINEFM
jgi:hypothetical protein